METGIKRLPGDEAFYYRHDKMGNLDGMISTHVDDFILAGRERFIEEITERVKIKLDISKMEDLVFRFTGIDVKKTEGGIEISMNDYAGSLEKINVRDGKADEPLTREEIKVFRKYVGKLNWLASNTRPDLSVYAMDLARRQKKAVLRDLRDVNRVLKKVEERESKVIFGKVARKEDLCVMAISDASYSQEDKSVAGEMILLGSKETKKAVPMFWKSGVIRKICTSPKAAETRGVMKIVDDAVNIKKQLKVLMKMEISLRVFTDSRPLLESVGSSSQVAEKQIRQSIAFLKQSLEDGDVDSYAWIEGKEIVADVLTKQGSKRDTLEEIMDKNYFRNAQDENNVVQYVDGEIGIRNLTMKQR